MEEKKVMNIEFDKEERKIKLSEKAKKTLKTVGIVVGSVIVFGVVALIALGKASSNEDGEDDESDGTIDGVPFEVSSDE